MFFLLFLEYGVFLMDDVLKYTELFDYYGNLLTEKERLCFKDYYFENLSLSEIAENNCISRNAVYKQIKSSEVKLIDYENKLNIISRDKVIKELLMQIKDERVSKVLEIM